MGSKVTFKISYAAFQLKDVELGREGSVFFSILLIGIHVVGGEVKSLLICPRPKWKVSITCGWPPNVKINTFRVPNLLISIYLLSFKVFGTAALKFNKKLFCNQCMFETQIRYSLIQLKYQLDCSPFKLGRPMV